jgi:16S rRNA (cytidine1402-2'-O)-methyltransferase
MALYLVPVPIGNLGDITLRALELLKKAELIACEDTRKTAFLLKQYDIQTPKLVSFHKFNERSREDQLISYLQSGKDLIVVSDAGSPAISDPAEHMVKEAITRGIKVFALPGASALVPAVSVAGFGTQQFQFVGFLPTQAKKRREKLQEIALYPYPTILYEAPHRIAKLLSELLISMGDRQVCLCREISKLHEEQVRGRLSDLIQENAFTIKGEFVLILAAADKAETCCEPDPDELEIKARELLKTGLGTRELANRLADSSGISRKQAYSLILKLSGKQL